MKLDIYSIDITKINAVCHNNYIRCDYQSWTVSCSLDLFRGEKQSQLAVTMAIIIDKMLMPVMLMY